MVLGTRPRSDSKSVNPLVSEKETSKPFEPDTTVTVPPDVIYLKPTATEKEGEKLPMLPHDSKSVNPPASENKTSKPSEPDTTVTVPSNVMDLKPTATKKEGEKLLT